MMRLLPLLRRLSFLVVGGSATWLWSADIGIQQDGDTVVVTVDGEPFTTYLASQGRNPALWPVYGPTGVEMTRGYPFQEALEGERTDHPHHRSIWFTHGDVNGVDYWSQPSDENKRQRGFGKVWHREFVRVSAESPHLVTRNEWVNSKDEKQLSDFRTISFGADDRRRWIDFDIRLVNDTTETVTFGDTKEGCFAVRVAHWMNSENGGTIINNTGAENKEAWGKVASWVDYHGEHEGQRLGIAILNHPSSYRFPTYWHVRTYGLFAANVFGLHNFKNSDEEDGSLELQPEESISFFYRLLLHKGDEQQGRVPESFVDYAKVDKTLTADEDAGAVGLAP